MNIKLEVIKLNTNDVITTSGNLCHKAKGIAFYSGGNWVYYMNDSDHNNPNTGNATYTGWQPDTSKRYHVNEYGVILMEECPINNEIEICSPENHNIGGY